jgi:hypothetical protein
VYANTGSREFVAPTQGPKSDWVLVLDDAAKDYPTGGPIERRRKEKPARDKKSLRDRDEATFFSPG